MPCFQLLDVHQRRSYVGNTNLCHNCLSSYNLTYQCGSTQRCHTCSKPHHTILHLPSKFIQHLRKCHRAPPLLPPSPHLITHASPVTLPMKIRRLPRPCLSHHGVLLAYHRRLLESVLNDYLTTHHLVDCPYLLACFRLGNPRILL